MAEKPKLVEKRHKAAALSNLGVGVPEGTVALAEQAGTALVNALHNITDWAYMRQLGLISRLSAGVAAPEIVANNEDNKRKRRITYGIISLPSAGMSAWSAAGGAESLIAGRASEFNPWHAGTTAASLAVAGLMTVIGRRLQNRVEPHANPHLHKEVKDFNDHARLDAASSAVAVAGAGLHAIGLGWFEQGVGAAIGAYQAWRFRPTSKNLSRGLGGHNHDHEHQHDHNHTHLSDVWEATKNGVAKVAALGRVAADKVKERGRKPARKWATTAAAGAAALALTFGISGEIDGHIEAQPAPPSAERVESPTLLSPAPAEEDAVVQVFSGTCTPVERGDSQWSIVEHYLEQIMDEQPDTDLTNAATLLTAHENLAEIPDPHTLTHNDCISLPSDQTLTSMVEAPPQSDLGGLISELNQFSGWDQAMSAHPIYDQLDRELQEVAR